jgi:ATP-dependent Clp protease adaptor protein ClpS
VARPEGKAGGEVLEKRKPKTRKPRLFHAVLHNDDYTTMEFVVKILESVFHKPEPDAFRIMMQVHLEGKGICGAYTYEEAETKVATVHDLAQEAGFPLRATVEEA